MLTSSSGNVIAVTTAVIGMYDVSDGSVIRNGGDTIVTGIADVIAGRYCVIYIHFIYI